MKQMSAVFFALIMVTVSLAGCFGGDDEVSTEETPTETLTDWGVYSVQSADDLPACNADTNGRLYYVEADDNFQVCKTSGWNYITIQGIAGTNGQDGAAGADGVAGANGQDGSQGTTGDNGQDGSQGTNGTSGQDGSQGTEGTPGQNGSQGATGAPGQDGSQGADGANGQDGSQGMAGINGTAGLTPLIVTSSEPAGTNCTNGGTRIDVGIDSDADGVLSTTELYSTQYVCDGGSSATTLLSSIATPSSELCDAGGRIMSHGLDNGDGNGIIANGQLESGEVDFTTTYCTTYAAQLLHDIETASSSSGTAFGSSPYLLFEHNGMMYFSATTTATGYELWVTDGTESGTMMVADINAGTSSSSPANFISNGDILYFAATTSANGNELWSYDSSIAISTTNPGIVSDIYSGTSSSSPYNLNVFGNSLYFTANDGTQGTELWKSNVTTGTNIVKDIYVGSTSSNMNQIVTIGNSMYFRATDTTNGNEMWKSDGTFGGTMMVANINPGSSDSYPRCFTDFGNDQIVFQANDGTHGSELWIYNSSISVSTSNPHLVVDIRTGSAGSNPCGYSSDSFVVINGNVMLQPYNVTYGGELWISDGTSQGTSMVADIANGTSSAISCKFHEFNNILYFPAYTSTYGTELWTYDPSIVISSTNPHMLEDVVPGTSSSIYCDPMMGDDLILEEFESMLYFRSYDNTYGGELWRYNPATDNITLFEDYYPGSNSGNQAYSDSTMMSFNNNLYWRCNNAVHATELCTFGTEYTITYS